MWVTQKHLAQYTQSKILHTTFHRLLFALSVRLWCKSRVSVFVFMCVYLHSRRRVQWFLLDFFNFLHNTIFSVSIFPFATTTFLCTHYDWQDTFSRLLVFFFRLPLILFLLLLKSKKKNDSLADCLTWSQRMHTSTRHNVIERNIMRDAYNSQIHICIHNADGCILES